MIFNKNKISLGVDGSRSGFIVQRAVTRLPFRSTVLSFIIKFNWGVIMRNHQNSDEGIAFHGKILSSMILARQIPTRP